MSQLNTQRRLAAKIMKCGESRVWLDPIRAKEIEEAITSGDVRRLIKQGAISERAITGTSRARAKVIAIQKSKGKRKGHGSRKGKAGARRPSKKAWMSTIRALRSELNTLRESGSLQSKDFRKAYIMAKSGVFRSRAHLKLFLKDHKMVKEKNGA